MYAIVRAGGRQEKVAVGDVIELDRVAGQVGDSVSLKVLLLVEDGKVTTDAATLANASVTGELVDHHRGPKIDILRYKVTVDVKVTVQNCQPSRSQRSRKESSYPWHIRKVRPALVTVVTQMHNVLALSVSVAN